MNQKTRADLDYMKKMAILKALDTPKNIKELGNVVGFYRLHALIADLRADGVILTIGKKIERYNFEII